MHLGIGYILIDMPRTDNIDNFAATINRDLSNPCLHQKFVLRLDIPGDEVKAEKVY